MQVLLARSFLRRDKRQCPQISIQFASLDTGFNIEQLDANLRQAFDVWRRLRLEEAEGLPCSGFQAFVLKFTDSLSGTKVASFARAVGAIPGLLPFENGCNELAHSL